MTYVLLSLPFIALAIAAAILLPAGRLRGGALRRHWLAVAIAMLALTILTAVFDSLMIAADLFDYGEGHILGIRIGLAPIEDFAYPLVTVLALPALWVALTARRRSAAAAEGPAADPAGTQRTDRGGQTGVGIGELLRIAVLSSRPVSWINTGFPFAAALFLGTEHVSWPLIVGTLYYLVPYNVAMYGINDVFDYESDLRNPRKGGIEGALLAPRFHRPLLWVVALSNVPFLIALCIAGGAASGLPALIAIAFSTFAVVAYSAPPMRFKERPLLDSFTSSMHFVTPAIVGFTLTGNALEWPFALAMLAFTCWGMAAHAFGAVQDIVPDRAASIHSIATAFGAARTVRFSFALWLAAGLLMLATPWPGSLAAIVAIPYLVISAPYLRVSDADSGLVNAAWKRFIWLNYGSGFIVTMVLILAWFQRS